MLPRTANSFSHLDGLGLYWRASLMNHSSQERWPSPGDLVCASDCLMPALHLKRLGLVIGVVSWDGERTYYKTAAWVLW